MFSSLAISCLLALQGHAAKSTELATTLHITNKEIAPDGFSRSTVLAQGKHPSPLIKGEKGDRFRVNVVNSLTDDTMLRSTSIHWHGIFQSGAAWNDGPTGVSQCPIAPGHSFLYDFPTTQAGTFWYHSHFGTQYCDGLRGPLVLYDPQDPHKKLYDVDDDSTIITLSEWYHVPSPAVVGAALADTTLINGKGRYIGGPLVDLAIVNVEPGRRYRMRLVSISCDPNFIFSIDGHSLTVIEADGQSTLPHNVDSIQIFVGQRYSFILNANQNVGNYWIRALPNSGTNGLSSGFVNATNSAILRYKGARIADPITTPHVNPTMLEESDLRPLTDPHAPGKPGLGAAEVNMNLALGFDAGNFTINGATFVSPTVPVLLQMMSGTHAPQDLLPQRSIYALPLNKVVEISIPGGSIGGPHPFHLHGHSFSVIKSAGNNTKPNYANPVRRDVVSIGGAGSNVTIRFTTDNAGPWFLHCHIDYHLNTGLAIVFAEGLSDTKPRNTPPAAWNELCPIYDALPASATSVRTLTASGAASTPTSH